MEKDLIEFLVQSNYIENEHSQQAYDDALLAWDYLEVGDYLTEKVVLATHLLLLFNLAPDLAGHYRKVNVMVGDRPCPQWEEVPTRMDALLDMKPKGWEAIKGWHIAFEKCHPFQDGNGRTGRIIMNWHRIKQGLPILVIHEGKEQHEYYEWFR